MVRGGGLAHTAAKSSPARSPHATRAPTSIGGAPFSRNVIQCTIKHLYRDKAGRMVMVENLTTLALRVQMGPPPASRLAPSTRPPARAHLARFTTKGVQKMFYKRLRSGMPT